MLDTAEKRLEDIREIVSEVLELEPEEVSDTGSFVDEYDADSLRAIEILARLEKKYQIEIPQSELARMVNLKAVYEVLGEHAGWKD